MCVRKVQPRAPGLHTNAILLLPFQGGQCALYLAAEHGQLEIAKLLLLAGANANVQTMVRRRILHTYHAQPQHACTSQSARAARTRSTR